MNRALQTAASGMYAQQLNIDTIANNLSNVNSTAFKKVRPEFQDLMYQTIQASGISQDPAVQVPLELQVGNGVTPSATLRFFTQGSVETTSNPLDIAIVGDGFFQVRRPDGTIVYTRDGALKLSSEGMLVTPHGYQLEPGLVLPQDATEVSISRDGVIEAQTSGAGGTVRVGQLELAKFVNPAGLRAIGNNLFEETVASGAPLFGAPGSEEFGETMQGNLESSNVDIVEEMINMITAQRAYEINAKTIKTVEEMMTIANGVKR
jgi:flagellar basal-body rod protein FlgG